jgi:type I site-specific restriction endonuclease
VAAVETADELSKDMSRADLVVFKRGQPIAVVEAKARPVSPRFQQAVLRQLRTFATDTGSRWSILVDPDRLTIFRGTDMTQPWVSLSTGEVLRPTTFSRSGVVGERVLLEVVDRWLHDLPTQGETLQQHPELRDFVKDVDGITTSSEVQLKRELSGGRTA